MRKDQKVVNDRAKYVQEQVNSRHKSLNVADVVRRIALELFLSEATIWADLTKKVENEKTN